MTARRQPRNEPLPGIPRIDLEKWLPQLLDQFMSAWNNRLEDRLAKIGLSFPQWRILLITSQSGSKTIRELSNATLVPHSTLARWVRQMEKDGLVRTAVFSADKRAVKISITADGHRTFSEAFPIAVDVQNEALKDFSPGERKVLMKFIHRLRTNIGMS
jgi:DNA-binding MarR family transcriptional regulator